MPARNSRKNYLQDSYYHIYNRGVEKRNIFLDEQDYEQDYGVFLSSLKNYLTPKNIEELQKKLTDPRITWREKDKILKLIRLNNFYGEINLLCYCLMPNHFHLLIKQKSSNAIDRFMNSLNTKYVMYFNKKYSRVGPLFEGVYKAVLVKTTEQLMYLSAYIHGNPSEKSFLRGEALNKLLSQPSSLPEYLGLKTTNWVETSLILNLFPRQKGSYEKFVLNNLKPHRQISSLILKNKKI